MNFKKLNKFTGSKGRPAYIAYKDKIFDVSSSKLWEDGIHANIHQAGQDLTEFMSSAPHGPEVLERVPEIGRYSRSSQKSPSAMGNIKEFLFHQHKKLHFHLASAHFPISSFIFCSILDVLYLFRDHEPFAIAKHYALLFGALALPVSIGTGILSWWLHYNLALTSIFKKKISASLVLFVLVGICLIIELTNPEGVKSASLLGWIYHASMISFTPLVMYLGYQGGKIMYPR